MGRSSQQLRAFGVGILLSFGAFALGQLVVGVTALGFIGIGIDLQNRPAILLGMSTVMLQGVTFGGVALGYLYYKNLDLSFIRARVPTLQDLGLVVVGFIVLFGLLQTISQLVSALGLQSAQNSVVDIASGNPIVFLLLVPLSFILIGPGEELLYRGLIQGILRNAFSPVRAIVLASALFSLIHIFSIQGGTEGRMVYLGIVFALALVLGSLYEYTDNIVVPALVHGAYNATLFGVQYLAAVDMIPQ